MVLPTVVSRDDVDEKTLIEIAEACQVSSYQIEDIYACTPLQSRSMAESAINSGASVFQFVLSLGPPVDIDRWCAAFGQVVSLNSVLRTRLVDCRLGLVQVVMSKMHYTERRTGDVEQYMRDDKAQPLDLGVPLFRSVIINRKWVLTMHHAVMDHSSLASLFRDVINIYHGQAPETRSPSQEDSLKEYILMLQYSGRRADLAENYG